MSSLLLLIFIAALPVLIASLWLVLRKYPFGPLWFFSAMLAGIIALFVAALIQNVFPTIPENSNTFALIFKNFIQIALTEEGSRLILLILFFKISSRFKALGPGDYPSHALTTGLIAGLGFALIETLSYAQTDYRIALIRIISASPLHAACGARTGMSAASICRRNPDLKGFIYAFLIHGMYNLLIIRPGIPAFFPLVLAIMVLISSIARINFRGEII